MTFTFFCGERNEKGDDREVSNKMAGGKSIKIPFWVGNKNILSPVLPRYRCKVIAFLNILTFENTEKLGYIQLSVKKE